MADRRFKSFMFFPFPTRINTVTFIVKLLEYMAKFSSIATNEKRGKHV